MRWINVNSVKELKELGRFKDVTREIKEDLGETFKIKGRSWNTVYDNIVEFRETIKNINEEIISKETDDYTDIYFSSLANEYIYYLVELDGDARMKKLGIVKTHFTNKKKAKAWRDKISKVIHPDISKHPSATDAMTQLNSMYSTMVGRD